MKRLVPLAIAVLVAGAVALDRVNPSEGAAAEAVEPLIGARVLSCPAAVIGSARAFLHLANFGPEPATVRTTVIGARGKPAVIRKVLKPDSTRTIRLSGRVKGDASAVVEHDGDAVVATHSLWFQRTPETSRLKRVIPPRGGAAAACMPVSSGRTVLPHLRTASRAVTLVLFNPGAASADVKVSIVEGRRVTQPTSFDRIVAPRSSLTLSLTELAFNLDELAAVIQADTGVVAEAFTVAETGVTLTEALSATEESPIVIAGASGRSSEVGLAVAGDEDTGLGGTLISRSGQGRATRLPPDLAPADTVTRSTPRLDDGGPVAYVLGVDVGGPLLAGTSWRADRRGAPDRLAVNAVGTAERWLGVIGGEQKRALTRLIVVNPSSEDARVTVKRVGRDPREHTVQAGRLLRLTVNERAGEVAVEVTSDTPVAVALELVAVEVGRRFVTTYGLGVNAVPVREPTPVPIAYDPRDAVPAPRTR